MNNDEILDRLIDLARELGWSVAVVPDPLDTNSVGVFVLGEFTIVDEFTEEYDWVEIVVPEPLAETDPDLN